MRGPGCANERIGMHRSNQPPYTGNVVRRVPSRLRETVIASPELFLPVFVLFTWKVTALVSGPRTLILALLSTGILVILRLSSTRKECLACATWLVFPAAKFLVLEHPG